MYAYYCLHHFHWAPSQFANLPLREKALVIEMIDEMLRNQKGQRDQYNKGR